MNKQIGHLIEVTLDIPRDIDAEVAGDIEKESVFVSPIVDRISVDDGFRTATVHLKSDGDVEAALDKARRYLEVMCKQLSGFETKVFASNVRKDGGAYVEGVNEELVERGWMHDYGKGQVAYSGPVLRLARLVDQTAADLYGNKLAVNHSHFPALVDADTLHKCGYFDSHPNAVTFIGNVIEDFDAIEAFRQANSCSEGALMPPHEHVHHDGMCLNPAACFPAYPSLKGREFKDGECFTWMGRVFRYESRNISGLDRLYEFNVRELVFVGSEAFVAETRQKALPVVTELAVYFDLDCQIQTATDPFFATVSAAKKFFQASQEVKNEIKIPVLGKDGEKKLIACGSINLHGAFFGERFEFTDGDGHPAHTGCVGLGIERWVLAGFTQHGFEPGRWPAHIRQEIFG